MMKTKKTLEQEINEFLQVWDVDQMSAFLNDITPLFDLYDVDEENDWVEELVGKENQSTIRLIRTVYLISRIAEFHSSALCNIKMNFRNIYERMEKESIVDTNENGID